MQLVRSGPAGSAALELAVSHALLTRVAAGELPPTLRVYRPAPAVAFGKLDTLRPGYAAAVEPPARTATSRCCACPAATPPPTTRASLAIDVVWALDDPVVGTHDRFAAEGERLAGALRTLGVDARVGEVPGEYCPGAYSVNARGRVKLIGTAQRLVRGAALLGASIVVGDGPGIRAVLDDVYAALEFAWDATTAGAVDEEVPGVTLDAVEAAVIAAYGDLEPASLDETTLALARRLEPQRRPLGVEAEAEAVEEAEPGAAAAVVAVGGGEAVAGVLDDRPAQGLRGEGERLGADVAQAGGFGVAAVEQVERGAAAEAGGADAEAGVAGGVGDAAAEARCRRRPRSARRCRSRRPSGG